MNTTSLKRAVFVALALGAASATAAFADTDSTTGTTTPPATGEGWHHHHHHGAGVLTSAERTELKNDRETVFASNPSLKTQEESLHQQFKALKSSNASQAQFEALKQQKDALRSQVRTAIEGVDSGAAALFAKIDAARAAHQH